MARMIDMQSARPRARYTNQLRDSGMRNRWPRLKVRCVTLDAFVVAVQRHREQMALLLAALEPTSVGPLGALVDHLERSNRELDRLCQELRDGTGLGDIGRANQNGGHSKTHRDLGNPREA